MRLYYGRLTNPIQLPKFSPTYVHTLYKLLWKSAVVLRLEDETSLSEQEQPLLTASKITGTPILKLRKELNSASSLQEALNRQCALIESSLSDKSAAQLTPSFQTFEVLSREPSVTGPNLRYVR